jgi:hypothetical protein
MAGLNSLLSDTQQTQTTMPAWYDAAQQNIVNQGTQAAAATPQLGQTVAQNAINTLQPGAQNPFSQAQNSLQQISSGAANPWLTDASGNVTPNTDTAMGGLFKAQQQQLNQLLPEYSAPSEAGAIGSGNFGSLRGQTAIGKARGDAFDKLNAAQLQAALSNQSTGATSARYLGDVANQGISSAMNVGMAQQNAPFQGVANYASLLGTLAAPTTVSSQTQLSPLSQAAVLANTYNGIGKTGGLSPLIAKAGNLLGNLFSGSGSGGTPAQQIGTDQATQDYMKENPMSAPRDDAGNIMPGWQNNDSGGLSWTGNYESGGTPAYDIPDGWGADETYY